MLSTQNYWSQSQKSPTCQKSAFCARQFLSSNRYRYIYIIARFACLRCAAGGNFVSAKCMVYGLGRTALAVCGTACVAIDVGDGRPLEHEIEVLDTNNRVVILGRRFLARFKNTTFDWENMRVRLGGCWKTSLAEARGGYAATRAEIMQTEMGKEGDSLEARFDINPKLSPREETVEMERRFRGKPEEPARNWNRRTRYHFSG